ncbi:MAG: hypothetical protein HY901_05825 [Deltaproteobacteria bacterium]|nr:hypothetical protein [Deltaproteobacteria bacterium]
MPQFGRRPPNPQKLLKAHEEAIVRTVIASLPDYWTRANLDVTVAYAGGGRVSVSFATSSPEGNSGAGEPPPPFHESLNALIALAVQSGRRLTKIKLRLEKNTAAQWESSFRYEHG